MDFESIQLHTARILRDNPDLRTVDKKEKVLEMVRKTKPEARAETVFRQIRYLQHDKGLYKPESDDGRFIAADEYRKYYSKKYTQL